MTRVLWFGDAADSGFGTVTRAIGTRLIGKGVDVRFLMQNMNADPLPAPLGERSWDASRVSPEDLRAIMTRGFRDGWKPERAVILLDYVAARGLVDGLEFRDLFATIPTLHYVPIEGIGLPPSWASLWNVLKPVAMSEFGADEIARLTGTRPPVIYHGVDRNTFHPVSASHPIIVKDKPHTTRREAKAFFGLDPDRILAIRTDRNMPRKRYPSLLRAMVPAMERVPNLDLLIHCRPQDQGGDLYDLIGKMPQSLNGRVILTKQHDTWRGLPADTLALMYNAADFYISTGAEGFGLTIVESIACGTPAIGLGYSAVPEVIGDAGTIVPSAGLVDNEYAHYWAAIDEQALTEAVVEMATRHARRRRLGANGPIHVRRFDWDHAADQFAELLCDPASIAVSSPTAHDAVITNGNGTAHDQEQPRVDTVPHGSESRVRRSQRSRGVHGAAQPAA